MSDERFIELASLAYFKEERRAEVVKAGIMAAVEEMFR